MKTRAKTGILFVLLIAVTAAIALLCTQIKTNNAYADEAESVTPSTGEFVVFDEESVDAVFTFVKLTDTGCSVRIANKSEATKAIVPSVGTIDGKKYRVTEIASSGFSSCTNLVRVYLPSSIKKIGINAFMNCAKLERINLANVEEIGNNAFYKCPKLATIVIPKSVRKVGSYILRNNDTRVMIREGVVTDEWSSSWNMNNANQTVEYDSKYSQPMELEAIRNNSARSNDIIGYSIASGQPRNDDYYSTITKNNKDEVAVEYNGSIFIPAEYNNVPIEKIDEMAFSGAHFKQLIVEYSDNDLQIGFGAFDSTDGDSIVINRKAIFRDDVSDADSMNVFMESKAQFIALPNNLTKIPDCMFSGCKNLTNLLFIAPVKIDENYKELDKYSDVDFSGFNLDNESDRIRLICERELCIIKREKDSKSYEEGKVEIPEYIDSIGDEVFQNTHAIKNLHLYDTITTMGSYILEGWIGEKDENGQPVPLENVQTVHVHNSKRLNWNEGWEGGFDNIKYDKLFFEITLDPQDGKFVNSDEKNTMDVVYNEPIGAFPEVEKEYNEFVNWVDNDGKKYTATEKYPLKSNITLYAEWKENEYKIELDRQGGQGGSDFVMANMGKELPTENVSAPTRLGYDFMGYYELPNGEGHQYYYHDMTSGTYELDTEEPFTIYAHWRPIEYNIELHSGYGDGIVFGNVKITYGEGMRHAEKPVRAHYTFEGYFDEKGGKGTQYYNADMRSAHEWDKYENGILYAHWTPIEYNIEYKLGEHGHNNVNNPTKYTVESNFTFYEPTHDTMYFDYWQCNGNAITGTKGLSGNITVEAVWSADTQKIKLDLTNGNKDMTVSAPKVIVTLTSNSYIRPSSGKLILRIASNVESVTVNGNGYYYSMSIIIEDRDEDFVLYLHNISIIALQDYEAIKMYGDNMLYLYNTGSVVIRGRSRSDGNGGTAISCGELMINSYMNSTHSLTVNGGAGSNGTNGISGTDGGNGGYAIEANKVIINCDNVLLYGGVPGNGGNGSSFGLGFKGYGGSGAYPVKDMETKKIVFVTDKFSNVHFYKSVDGTDGTGIDRPQPPVIKPDPGYVIPPIIGGDDIPTPGPVVPPIINI